MTMQSVQMPTGRHSLLRTGLAILLAGTAIMAVSGAKGLRAQSPIPETVMTDMVVKYDQSHIVELSRPASEVIIGNPIIADVQVQSGNILIVTGKSFGITNIIILDVERKKIAEHRIIVARDDVRALNLWRSTKRQSYNCVNGQACNPSLVIGDDPEYFKRVQDTATNKLRFSAQGVESGSAGGGGGGGSPGGGEGPGGQ